jgi:uncharacterized protein
MLPTSLIRLSSLLCLLLLMTAPARAVLLISEVDPDTEGQDQAEFIELAGTAGQVLDGFSLVLYNGSNQSRYKLLDLAGQRLDARGFWVLCGNRQQVPGCALEAGDGFLQNGPDAVALYQRTSSQLKSEKGLVSAGLVDALVYVSGKADASASKLLKLLNSPAFAVDENSHQRSALESLQRCGDPQNPTLRSSADFRVATPTPGTGNACSGPAVTSAAGVSNAAVTKTADSKNKQTLTTPAGSGSPDCSDFSGITRISAIQGHIQQLQWDDSPLAGQVLSIEAVVTVSAQGGTLADGSTSRLYRGYWIQEETADEDNDPHTSEGIFVFDDKPGVQSGDRIRLTGLVSEFRGTTQISKVKNRQICARHQPLPPARPLTLPVADLLQLEALEGMRVTLAQPLLVSDFHGQGNSFASQGQLTLSSALHFQPAELALPGSQLFRDLPGRYRLDRLLLDDGVADANPAFIPFPDARGFAADNPVRIGDTVSSATGVLHASNDWYVLIPQEYSVRPTHPRSPQPPVSAEANLRIASMNVLNYFNGDGKGGGFPTERGAKTAEGFAMQSAKIVAALKGLDADIVALMELGNDGFGPDAAISGLLRELNRQLPAAKHYKAVEIDSGSRRAAIRNGLIYRPQSVSLLASGARLDSSNSARDAQGVLFDSGKQRPLLVQGFAAGSFRFAVAVAHLKSKGSPCGEPNEGADGQGNCNRTRTRAAQGLLQFLKNDPAGVGSDHMILLGDLNAYHLEDPVRTLTNNGLVDLKHSTVATEAMPWTYRYDGMLGSLDHALASPGLARYVVSAGAWHLNAAESDLLGYETEQTGQDYPSVDHYAEADAWRSSDHDPVVVGLKIPAK